MNNPLSGLGDLQKLQAQAQKMQAALQQEEVVVEKNGVHVVLRGDQQVVEVAVDGIIENRIAEAINEAVKKTQELAAKKLIEISQQGLYNNYNCYNDYINVCLLNYFPEPLIRNLQNKFLIHFMFLWLKLKLYVSATPKSK